MEGRAGLQPKVNLGAIGSREGESCRERVGHQRAISLMETPSALVRGDTKTKGEKPLEARKD